MYLKIGAFLIVLLAVGAVFLYRTQEAAKAPQASFGGVSLKLEIADTPASRERGLSGHAPLAEDEAMLFIFEKPDRYGIWMKNMNFPIDIFWLDDKGQVIFIEKEVATSSYPHVFNPPLPALYVLETRAGFAEAHDVAVGDSLSLQNL